MESLAGLHKDARNELQAEETEKPKDRWNAVGWDQGLLSWHKLPAMSEDLLCMEKARLMPAKELQQGNSSFIFQKYPRNKGFWLNCVIQKVCE